MKIETKYSIGDTVWFIHNGKPCCAQIERINIEVSHHGALIDRRYCLLNDELSECELYDNEAELISNTK